MKLTNSQCGYCDYIDGYVYTSLPPQVKCTITGEFHGYADLCTVEVEPVKRGKWEKVGDNSYKCSNCSEVSCCKGNYCPDCGAKMENKDGKL